MDNLKVKHVVVMILAILITAMMIMSWSWWKKESKNYNQEEDLKVMPLTTRNFAVYFRASTNFATTIPKDQKKRILSNKKAYFKYMTKLYTAQMEEMGYGFNKTLYLAAEKYADDDIPPTWSRTSLFRFLELAEMKINVLEEAGIVTEKTAMKVRKLELESPQRGEKVAEEKDSEPKAMPFTFENFEKYSKAVQNARKTKVTPEQIERAKSDPSLLKTVLIQLHILPMEDMGYDFNKTVHSAAEKFRTNDITRKKKRMIAYFLLSFEGKVLFLRNFRFITEETAALVRRTNPRAFLRNNRK